MNKEHVAATCLLHTPMTSQEQSKQTRPSTTCTHYLTSILKYHMTQNLFGKVMLYSTIF